MIWPFMLLFACWLFQTIYIIRLKRRLWLSSERRCWIIAIVSRKCSPEIACEIVDEVDKKMDEENRGLSIK